MQNEQTEQKQGFVLLLGTRSRMWIRREAMFVYSIKQFDKENLLLNKFNHWLFLDSFEFEIFNSLIMPFSCFMRSVHFATTPSIF